MSQGDPSRRWFAALFMTLGVLIVTLSGLCSLAALAYVIAWEVDQPHSGYLRDAGQVLLAFLVFGGVPISAGSGLIVVALRMKKGGRQAPSFDRKVFDQVPPS